MLVEFPVWERDWPPTQQAGPQLPAQCSQSQRAHSWQPEFIRRDAAGQQLDLS